MYLIALIVTIIGWLFQLYQTAVKKDKTLSPVLPLAYAVACILFGVNSFTSGEMTFGILDIVCAAIAAIVFIIFIARKK